MNSITYSRIIPRRPGKVALGKALQGAFNKGFHAFHEKKTLFSCPYSVDSGRATWSHSFRDAWEDGWRWAEALEMQTIITQRGYSQEETFAAKVYHDGPVKTVGMSDWHTVPDRDWMPIGSVEFCVAAMQHQRISIPEPLDYPQCLQHFLAKQPALYSLNAAREILAHDSEQSWHLKSLKTKLDRALWTPETSVWLMPWHDFVAEYRVYVCNGKIIGMGRYDDNLHDVQPDMSVVRNMVNFYQKSYAVPAGYGLDVGVSAIDGKTYLVEVNDGWALGLYKGDFHPKDYLRLLQARWMEIAKYVQK